MLTDEPPQATRTCVKCSVTKPVSVFGKDGHGRRGLTCNTCRNEARRARGEHTRRRPRETRAERRVRLLWEEYRLTPDQYTMLLTAQNGACAICRKMPQPGKRLAVDHCHATGVVRALLCAPCNLSVGMYERSQLAAANYLAVYGAGNPLLHQ